MMATTHAAFGAVLGLLSFVFFPEHTTAAVLAGFFGGLFPDVDLYVGRHRKTLHYPAYYWVPVILFSSTVLLWSSPLLVVGLFFFLAAAAHSASDIVGAGVEARPWQRKNSHAVYLHTHKRWVSARYWVPYDGSPQDLILCLVLFSPVMLAMTDSSIILLIYASMATSIAYSCVRKFLPDVADWLIENSLHPKRRY